jgi:putative PIN family toxin of toxin-antitoxin system
VRVVADTNILISALMFDGLPGVILNLVLDRRFTFVTSRPLLDELDEKLCEKSDVGTRCSGYPIEA